MNPPSIMQGRLCILIAAILWSLNGAFVKLLTVEPTLGLAEPPLDPLIIAFYRVLFAGLILAPTLKRRDIRFRPFMFVMVISFASMNALFVSALAMGTAANAIILQYTAPVWMYLAGLFLLGEKADFRNTVTLVIAMMGVVVIVLDALQEPTSLNVVLIGLGSGLAYAGVIVCLRVLRDYSSNWLTVLNHLFAALVLLPVIWIKTSPEMGQVLFLVGFGAIQMALPYWLASRALRTISPQEVGAISLLEPILVPIWAYLATGELPVTATYLGGGLILAALIWRYGRVWKTKN